jgi:PKD repeat protein
MIYDTIVNNWSANQTSGTAPMAVFFNDTSYYGLTYYWMFGDGNTSTQKSPTFTYNIAGTYSVNHSVSNLTATVWNNQSGFSVSGAGATPVAIFGCSPTAGVRGSIRVCNDSSVNTPDSWDYFDNPGANPCLATNLTTNNISFTSRHFGWCGPICLKASNAYGNNVNCSATNYLWSSMPWRS